MYSKDNVLQFRAKKHTKGTHSLEKSHPMDLASQTRDTNDTVISGGRKDSRSTVVYMETKKIEISTR